MSRRARQPSLAFVKFPGKPAVLKALKDNGPWTPTDVFRWSMSNGGSAATYAALHHYVEAGKVTYDGTTWTFVPRYAAKDSQIRTTC